MFGYDFEIDHQMGTQMRHVDVLSRNAVEPEGTTDVVEGVEILNIVLNDWIEHSTYNRGIEQGTREVTAGLCDKQWQII